MRAWAAFLVIAGLSPAAAFAEDEPDRRFAAEAELGFLAVIDHKLQLSRSGTYFDFDDEGGQDILFPVTRWSLGLDLGAHRIGLLYQPLVLETAVTARRDTRVDDEVFRAGEPLGLVYSFPFWRGTYLYDFAKGPRTELAVGGALQIRNARIEFRSGDGERFRSNRGIGPVPLLAVRARRTFERFWFGGEASGIYAPVSYLNGADNEITGALLDASVRGGILLKSGAEAFVNLRYLGGGAVGTSEDDADPGDGYVKNWLHFVTLSVGFDVALL